MNESGWFKENNKVPNNVTKVARRWERKELALDVFHFPEARDIWTIGWDPRLGVENERLMPTEDMKEVQISHSAYRVTKIGILLSKEYESKLFYQLIRNFDFLTWAPSDMPSIDTKMVCHRITINPAAKPTSQRKQKFSYEKRVSIDEEVNKII